MGYWTGRFSFGGTGTKTITVGSFTPTWARVTVADSDTNNISVGNTDGTRQNVQSTGFGSDNTSIIFLENDTATLFDAAWTSFGFSGSTGTVTFNVTTNTAGYDLTIEVGD